MVNFSVFNELSLPLTDEKQFKDFFEVLTDLKSCGLDKIRMDKKFTEYPEILPNTPFEKLLGQITNRDKQNRLKGFIKDSIATIESPLIKDEEIENNTQEIENEYLFDDKQTFGGLACCDVWNTIAVSFCSSSKWCKDTVVLQKNKKNINIRHASNSSHLFTHKQFFKEIEEFKRLDITRENFNLKLKKFFPNKIIFCQEIKKQIRSIDKIIFQQAIRILRDIETDVKSIDDFDNSGESSSVANNPKLKKLRCFTIDNKKVYFDRHIKNLPNANRIYFKCKENKIYIGYIGIHLPTKKF